MQEAPRRGGYGNGGGHPVLIVDIIAAAALLTALVAGLARGFFASLGSVVGMVAGAAAALWLLPLATPWLSTVIPSGGWRTTALAAAAIGLVVLGAAAGAAVGMAVRRGVDRARLRGLERVFGGVLTTVATALALLLVSSGLATAGIPYVSSAVASSRVIGAIDALTPPPVDEALAQARGVLLADGLPRLEAAIGAVVTPVDPPITLDDPELRTAAASVARVSGTAYACGVSMTGSGFVAAPGLVVTNAHVVAGVETPVVELPNGRAGEGRIVLFDPVTDLAIIAIGDLPASPLVIADPAVAGTQAAAQGYPHGGPFTSIPAGVLSVSTVPVPDIYDTSVTPREIYALDADVQPGNSGGPLLTGDGDVVGVVFARGADGEGRGYATSTAVLKPELASVTAGSPTVGSGRCTR